MSHVALAEQFVLQHRAQGWRERHGHLERHLVVPKPLHHLQQRNVAFSDCLEEPIFLEEMLMLRMPNERQVRVQNEREMVHVRYRIP